MVAQIWIAWAFGYMTAQHQHTPLAETDKNEAARLIADHCYNNLDDTLKDAADSLLEELTK